MAERTEVHIPDGWRLVNEAVAPGTYKRPVRWLTIHADEADGQCIAEVTGEELDEDQRVAIAALIAAAPETAQQRDMLLKAAKECRKALDHRLKHDEWATVNDYPYSAIPTADAAIAACEEKGNSDHG